MAEVSAARDHRHCPARANGGRVCAGRKTTLAHRSSEGITQLAAMSAKT